VAGILVGASWLAGLVRIPDCVFQTNVTDDIERDRTFRSNVTVDSHRT
jgi:hypothetical protein